MQDVEYREARLPMRRVARPEDVANVVSFVCGPQGRYLTGENIMSTGACGSSGRSSWFLPE